MKGRKIKATDKSTRSSIIMLLLVVFSLCACMVNDVSNQHSSISPDGWHQDSIQSFSIAVTQPCHYDVSTFVRHTSSYPYRNMWLFVEHRYDNRTLSVDTINLTLADSYGRWQGKGWGTTYQVQHALIHNQLLDTGTHTFNITQAMREVSLKGVINVGVSVRQHQE